MTDAPAREPVVRVDELTRRFGDFTAVDRVSFEVAPGEVFGFLGSNGAGKTTTIRMLCGLLEPTSGSAVVAGCDVADDPRRLKRRIGYMSQKFSLYTDLTVAENLRFWGAAYGLSGRRLTDRRRWALEMAGLERERDALVRELPAGFRQRLALGSALLHEPPVVFLDEPTGGVDPEVRRMFWDVIDDLAAADTTVFVTTHYMDEAERCHRVALMHAGSLLALDTVPGLKGIFDEGAVLAVACDRPAAAVPRLDGMDGVSDAALFGEKLHVVVDDDALTDSVHRRLTEAGHGPVQLERVPPSLEDVFIRVIRDADAGRAA